MVAAAAETIAGAAIREETDSSSSIDVTQVGAAVVGTMINVVIPMIDGQEKEKISVLGSSVETIVVAAGGEGLDLVEEEAVEKETIAMVHAKG